MTFREAWAWGLYQLGLGPLMVWYSEGTITHVSDGKFTIGPGPKRVLITITEADRRIREMERRIAAENERLKIEITEANQRIREMERRIAAGNERLKDVAQIQADWEAWQAENAKMMEAKARTSGTREPSIEALIRIRSATGDQTDGKPRNTCGWTPPMIILGPYRGPTN